MIKGWEELKLMAEHFGHDTVVSFVNNLRSSSVKNVGLYDSFRSRSEDFFKTWMCLVNWEAGKHTQYSFDWSDSPEGFEYWREVKIKLETL